MCFISSALFSSIDNVDIIDIISITYSTEASMLALYVVTRPLSLEASFFCLVILGPTTSGRNSLYVTLCKIAPTILRVF